MYQLCIKRPRFGGASFKKLNWIRSAWFDEGKWQHVQVVAKRTFGLALINSLCKTETELDENILSKDEYEKALAGKRHCRDFKAVSGLGTDR